MPNPARVAVLHFVAALVDLPVDAPQPVVHARIRDEVLVGIFGARPGFGDQPDEHRFRIDNHWPVKK